MKLIRFSDICVMSVGWVACQFLGKMKRRAAVSANIAVGVHDWGTKSQRILGQTTAEEDHRMGVVLVE